MRTSHKQTMREAGLSLIELMIAMLVGLILIGGVLSVFMSSRKSYGVNGAMGQIQENGRFAMNFIDRDTRMAGYLGCGGSTGNVGNQLKPPANTTLAYNFTNGLAGFEYSGTEPGDTYSITSEALASGAAGDWGPSLDPSLPLTGSDYVVPGSDVLVIRFSPPTAAAAYVASSPGPNGAQFWLTTNPGIASGSLLIISNCVNTYVVQADQVNGSGTDHVVVNTGNSVSPGNAVAGIPTSFIGAQVSTVETEVFYVGMDATGSPALFEAVTNPNCAAPNICFGGFEIQELVPNVENMQVLYGVDTTGSQMPSEYDTADVVDAANEWGSVVSVRVALLMRSNLNAVSQPAAAQSYDMLGATIHAPLDTRLRQVYTTTIGLRNRLP
jgi:type IV pilus assembly protein PilW